MSTLRLAPTRMRTAALLIALLPLLAAHAQEQVSANLMHPDWHPDGRRLIAEGGCAGSIDLYLIDLETDAVTFLWDDGVTEGYPRWFPDGKRIAFHKMNRPERRAEIFTAKVSQDGEIIDIHAITRDSFTIEPAPSPDGKHVAYTLPGDNGLDVAVLTIGKNENAQILETPYPDNFPSWSPDGTGVLFYSRRDDTAQIFIYDTATEEIRQVTHAVGPNFTGHFRPDGTAIAYASERDGDREIYILNLETGEDKRLTEKKGRDGYPKFSPDGTRIAYHSAHEDRPTTIRILDLQTSETREFSCADVVG